MCGNETVYSQAEGGDTGMDRHIYLPSALKSNNQKRKKLVPTHLRYSLVLNSLMNEFTGDKIFVPCAYRVALLWHGAPTCFTCELRLTLTFILLTGDRHFSFSTSVPNPLETYCSLMHLQVKSCDVFDYNNPDLLLP